MFRYVRFQVLTAIIILLSKSWALVPFGFPCLFTSAAEDGDSMFIRNVGIDL